jgi:hypothetical protein
MSLHQWNSVAEHDRLQRYVLLAEMMLEEEEDDDSTDDDSEEASGGVMDMEMEFIDQELSFITDIDDDNHAEDEEEEGDKEDELSTMLSEAPWPIPILYIVLS